ncbi:hypothetical protein KP509_1Z157900 [Ceratopteris richardii]|nr:hypothetical protein KP509_1Z157900 [Ceratopteris richardii]
MPMVDNQMASLAQIPADGRLLFERNLNGHHGNEGRTVLNQNRLSDSPSSHLSLLRKVDETTCSGKNKNLRKPLLCAALSSLLHRGKISVIEYRASTIAQLAAWRNAEHANDTLPPGSQVHYRCRYSAFMFMSL